MAVVALTEEENALKNTVTKALQSQGTLDKIRAQLRAAVYEAIDEEQSSSNEGNTKSNNNNTSIHKSQDGTLMANIILEFLEFHNLKSSAAVFAPESSSNNNISSRTELQATLRSQGLTEFEESQPLLLGLLHAARQQQPPHQSDPSSSFGESIESDASTAKRSTRSRSNSPSPRSSPKKNTVATASPETSLDASAQLTQLEGKLENVTEDTGTLTELKATLEKELEKIEGENVRQLSPTKSVKSEGYGTDDFEEDEEFESDVEIEESLEEISDSFDEEEEVEARASSPSKKEEPKSLLEGEYDHVEPVTKP